MNMKPQNIYHLLQAALLLLLASCTQEEFPAAPTNKARQLAISVTDGGYSSDDGKTTRAVENGYTTEFTEGDACGLFVTRGWGVDTKLVYSNVKLTAERDAATGSLVWTPEEGTALAGGLSNEDYHLYYPYKPDLDDQLISMMLDRSRTDTPEHFFNPLANNWQVKADQSSYADYAASDLMTASCTPTMDNGALRLDFVMTHVFALVVIEMPKTVYKFTDARVPDYIVQSEAQFTGTAKPLRMDDGTYRYLLQISLPTIEGSYDDGKREFTITPSTACQGEYKKYKVDNAATTIKSYTVQRGDYLLADGHLLPKGTALTEEQKSKVAAIVFWTPAETDPAGRQTPASLADDKIMAKDYSRCTHGLAVSIKNISSEMAWQKYDRNFGSVKNFQNSYDFNPTDKADYVSVSPSTNDLNRILGYQNTKIIMEYNDYCKGKGKILCFVKPVDALAGFSNSNPAPRTSTGWFFPSVKELFMLCHKDQDKINDAFNPINNPYETNRIIEGSLSAVGGELLNDQNYSSSSEYDVGNIRIFSFKHGSVQVTSKEVSCAIRAVCAF